MKNQTLVIIVIIVFIFTPLFLLKAQDRRSFNVASEKKDCEELKHGENKESKCYRYLIQSGRKLCQEYEIIYRCDDGKILGDECSMKICSDDPFQQRGMSFAGGSRRDPFYEEEILGFKNSISNHLDETEFYFGGDLREGRCYSRLSAGVLKGDFEKRTIEEIRKDFMEEGKCDSPGAGIIRSYIHGSYTDPQICSAEEKLTGEATQENYNSYFDTLINDDDLKEGDRVYINITGHGSDTSAGDDSHVIHLSDKTKISSNDLKKKLEKLYQKGINVQLSFHACFSGGFTNMVHELNQQVRPSDNKKQSNKICSSSFTTDSTLGYYGDPLLRTGYETYYFNGMKKYNNQLSAFACGAGSDFINRPITSLDNVVMDWNIGRGDSPNADTGTISCSNQISVESYLDESIQKAHDQLNDISLALKRKLILKDFEKLFIRPLKECWMDGKKELEFFSALGNCLTKGNTDQDLRELFGIANSVDEYQSKYSNFLLGEKFDIKLVDNHLAMLQSHETTEEELNDYLSQFCCLGYNFQTRKGPESCELLDY